MFNYDQPPSKQTVNYTGLKIGASLLPVFVLFVCLGKTDMGFTVSIVLGMTMVAVYLHWKLRKHVWFWVAISLVALLHLPLLFVRWPESKVPTIAYSMPLGLVDFLLINGSISLAESAFSKGTRPDRDSE
jgi:hypothetical protein